MDQAGELPSLMDDAEFLSELEKLEEEAPTADRFRRQTRPMVEQLPVEMNAIALET